MQKPPERNLWGRAYQQYSTNMKLRKKTLPILIGIFLLIWAQTVPAALLWAVEAPVASQSAEVEAGEIGNGESTEEDNEQEGAEPKQQSIDEVDNNQQIIEQAEVPANASAATNSGEIATATESALLIQDISQTSEATEAAVSQKKSVDLNPDEAKPDTTESKDDEPDTAANTIITGDATASAILVNEANTTIIGEAQAWTLVNYALSGETGDELDLDFSDIRINCTSEQLQAWQTYSEEMIINNQAVTDTEAVANSETGHNQAGDLIVTGDAEASAAVVNLINTTLIGDCWYWGMINLFDPYTGDIILPYESQFLDVPAASSLASVSEKSISVTNEADVTNTANLEAETGRNELMNGGTVETGSAQTSAQVADQINTAVVGDRWLLLEIFNPQYWTGALKGLVGNFSQTANSLFLWLPLPASNGGNQTADSIWSHIAVNNYADVRTTTSVYAGTGNNLATNTDAVITTGDASARSAIVNHINTTLIGSNWYYMAINLFDNFNGNIIFPRADLEVALGADSKTVQSGDVLAVVVPVRNSGLLAAEDIQVTVIHPETLELVGYSNGSGLAGGVVSWLLPVLDKGKVQVLTLYFQASEVDKPVKVVLSATAASAIKEDNYVNNKDQLSIAVIPPAPERATTKDSSRGGIVAEETTGLLTMQPQPTNNPSALPASRVLGVFDTADSLPGLPEDEQRTVLQFPLRDMCLPDKQISPQVLEAGWIGFFKRLWLFLTTL